jgi:oxygen-dependent protoporphyrinogen oxidase
VVIGGGVSGLATACHLAAAHDVSADPALAPPARVTVLEADDRVGGRVGSTVMNGVVVDTGPEALMMRSPAVSALISRLGLDGELRAPAGSGAYLWSRGALRPLPAGSVFGVPDRLWPLLRSGLVRPWGFVRAGADLSSPAGP